MRHAPGREACVRGWALRHAQGKVACVRGWTLRHAPGRGACVRGWALRHTQGRGACIQGRIVCFEKEYTHMRAHKKMHAHTRTHEYAHAHADTHTHKTHTHEHKYIPTHENLTSHVIMCFPPVKTRSPDALRQICAEGSGLRAGQALESASTHPKDSTYLTTLL